jgi:hypothetical protein
MTTIPSPSLRTASGRFAKGSSGNPAGRPKGARNRATLMAEALETGDAKICVRKLAKLALAGDSVALRFLIGRYAPKPRDLVALDLPEAAAGDPRAVYQATLRGVVKGEIAPGEGLRVARLLVMNRKVRRAPVASPATLGRGTTWSPAATLYSKDGEKPRDGVPDVTSRGGNPPVSPTAAPAGSSAGDQYSARQKRGA